MRRARPAALILLVWIVATAFNLTKAVHIDDTAYLSIAQHIVEEPLHPMSGSLNWHETVEPMHYRNQPALLFYLFAGSFALVGESEIALHALMSLFTLAALIFFYLLARHFAEDSALVMTAMFGLGPAFIPSQNLMTDIPMIALWLAFFWALLCHPSGNPTPRRYVVAATAAALACLIKYTSLVLIPILLLDLGLRKQWRTLWVVGIPLGAIAGWSLFNYVDYGGVHLLGRPTPTYNLVWVFENPLAWIIGLGAVAPFSLLALPYSMRHGRLLVLESLLFGALVGVTGLMFFEEPPVHSLLRALFTSNGVFVVGVTLQCLVREARKRWAVREADALYRYLILLAWLAGPSAFIILFAPFMAARHYLILIPVALLSLGVSVAPLVGKRWVTAGLAATVALGVILGVSDWTFADGYRLHAERITQRLQSRSSTTIWYTGHLGWQWYAGKAGMKQYDTRQTVFTEGDFLVEPLMISKQTITPAHLKQLKLIETVTIEATPATYFRITLNEPRGGYYRFSGFSLPWTLSAAPVET
ncbi:MAG: ArnT family glycosyltransferase, partial [Nitrospinota bacterium]